MEANKYNEASVAFALAPSRRLAAFIVLAAAATACLLLAVPLPGVVVLALMAWCTVAAAHALARNRACDVRVSRGTSITVGARVGAIAHGSFVAPWLTIVHWRPLGARFTRTLVVLPDMIDAESFRALRVILRWAPPV
jgi:toxin CptA